MNSATARTPRPATLRRPQPKRLAMALAAVSMATLAVGPVRGQNTLPAGALPSGLSVAAGQAQVAVNGNRMTVVNTPQAILNWQTFSIGAGNAVHFQQANAVSSVLNRVTGNDPSAILGSLSSNGRVWLLNPNGVLFGANARVDVAGLVTSTLRLNDSDFLAGRYSFSAGNPSAEVLNQGELRSSFGGTIALLGDSVRNEGTVQADGGQIILAAGKSIELVDTGAPNLGVRITADAGAARNLGTLQAAGGRIDIHAAAVNSSGIVSADGFATGPGGEIWIKASGTTELTAGSHTSANSTNEKAGSVVLLGQNVGLLGDAQVQADGATGGGHINVGGGLKGQDTRFPNAQAVYFGPQARISADATGSGNANGNGGQIILWSDQSTRAYGSLSARGGLLGGNGGFIETSGGWLDAQPAKVDTTAPMGRNGEWLLDPWDLFISNTASDTAVDANGTNPVSYLPNSNGAQISAATITAALNAGNSVTVSTGTVGFETGNITISNATITPTSGSAGNLVFEAAKDITVSGSNISFLSNSSRSIELRAKAGKITVNSASRISTGDGTITLGGDSVFNATLGVSVTGALGDSPGDPSGVSISGNSQITTGGTVRISGRSIGGSPSAFGGVNIQSSTVSAQDLFIAGEATADNVEGRGVYLLFANLSAARSLDLRGLGPNGVFAGASSITTGGAGGASINARATNLNGRGFWSSGGVLTHNGSSFFTLYGEGLDGREGVRMTGEYSLLANNGPIRIETGPGNTLRTNAANLTLSSGSILQADTLQLDSSTIDANGSVQILGNFHNYGGTTINANAGTTVLAGAGGPAAAINNAGNGLTLNSAGTGRWRTFTADRVNITEAFQLNNGFSRYGAGSVGAADGDTGNGFVFTSGFNVGTVTGLVGTRNYDGTTSAPLTIDSGPSGESSFFYTQASDATAVYANANAGVNKPATLVVGPSGGLLDVRDNGNKPIYGYTVDTSGITLTGTVNQAVLTYGNISATTRVYDGTRDVQLTGSDLSGLVGTETVGVSLSGLYDTKGAGTNKPIAVSAAISDGTNGGLAGNYRFIEPESVTGTVTRRPLTVTGYTAADKTYDGTTSATISGSPVYTALPGDNVVVYTTPANSPAGTFADKNAGPGKTVTVNNLLLDGNELLDYEIVPPTLTATINQRPLLISGLAAQNKVYDRTNAATMALSNGSSTNALGGDTVTVGGALTGTFASLNAGTHAVTLNNASVVLGGADAGNYAVAGAQGAVSATITPRPVAFSGLSVANKVYDGNTAATVNGTASVTPLAGDTLTVTGTPTSVFGSKNVGTYTVGISGLSLGGSSAANYSLSGPSGGLSADITPRPFYLVSNPTVSDKVYDGTTTATVTATLTPDIVGTDNVVSNGTLAWNFASRNVGTHAVAPSGLSLTGTDAGNYTLNLPGLSGTITARALSVAGLAVQSKTYDGTTAATITGTPSAGPELIPGDNVSFTLGTLTGTYATKNVGTGIAVSALPPGLLGSDAGNYTLSPLALTGDITPRVLTWTGLSVQNKVYDGTPTASLNGTASVTPLSGDVVNVVGTPTTAFPSKNAGFYPGLLVTGLSATGADAGNYQLAGPSGGLSGQIQVRPVGITGVTVDNKVYDGTTAAPFTGFPAATGLVAGDAVSISVPAGPGGPDPLQFDTKNVGTGKPVSLASWVLTGTDSGNYTLSGVNLTGTITPKPITVGNASYNRVYDTTRLVGTVSTADITPSVIEGDNVFVPAQTPVQLGTADKNVGINKPVSVIGGSLSGVDAPNYQLTTGSSVATITLAPLGVTGLTAPPKVYDATLTTTITGTPVATVLPGDTVLFGGTPVGIFNSKNVGQGTTVSIAGLSIGGPDGDNYSFITTPTLPSSITPRPLPLGGLSVAPKVYDGTTAAGQVTSPATVTPLAGDTVSLFLGEVPPQEAAPLPNVRFADKNVGTNKPLLVTGLSLQGQDAGNYTLVTTGLTGSITPRALGVGGLSASNKVYDGTTSVTIGGGGSVSGAVVQGDNVGVAGSASGQFATKDVGLSKTVQVTGYSLTGSDAANYSLGLPSLTADITPLPVQLGGVGAANKVYDGTLLATLTGTPVAATVAGDAVSVVGSGTGVFADKNVGTGKAVQVNGYSLGGADAGNYLFSTPPLAANITPLAVTLGNLSVQTKTYDASTRATLVGALGFTPLAGDTVSIAGQPSVAFADKNVGTNKPVQVTGLALTGADAANYTLPATASATGTITPLTVRLTGLLASDKVYDSTVQASLAGTAAVAALPGDTLSLAGTPAARFADKNAGSDKAVLLSGFTLSGADAGNYRVELPSLTASITPRPVAMGGVGVLDKTYDGNTRATVSGTPLLNTLAGDAVLLQGTLSGNFASKNAGTGVAVSLAGVALGGADAGNYNLTLPQGLRANINPLSVTVQGLTANNKVYDAVDIASLSGTAAVTAVPGDALSLSGTPVARFADRNAGDGKAVNVSGYALSGADAGNYRLQQPQGLRANITPAALQYVANPVEILAGEPIGALTGSVTGFVGSDTLANATTGLSIFTVFLPDLTTVGSYPISGSGLAAVNYTFAQAPANATALNILPIPVDTTTPLVAVATNTVVLSTSSAVLNSTGPLKALADAVNLGPAAALQRRSEAGVVDVVALLGSFTPRLATPFNIATQVLAPGNTASGSSAPAFGAVRLSSMSSDEISRLLADRNAYTQALFSDANAKLARQPDLADLKACESLEEANAGRCLITPGLRSRLANAGTSALTAPAPTVASTAPAATSAPATVPASGTAASGAPSAATVATAPAPTTSAATALALATPARSVQPAVNARLLDLQRAQRKVKTAALPQIERKIALVLGVGTYEDSSIPSLANATRDSDAVAQVLETQLGYETVVLNNASKAEVVAAMNRIALTAGPRDSVVVYYAGHGELVETTKQGYWLLADSEAKKPETWLSNADINRLVGQIGASQVALISDSCYSGTLASEERIRATPTALDPKAVLDRKSVVVMSSGGNQPVADDGRDGHSPFAWHLMDTVGKVNNWQAGGNIFERVRFAVARALPQRPQYSASRSAGHQPGGEYLFEQRRLDGKAPL